MSGVKKSVVCCGKESLLGFGFDYTIIAGDCIGMRWQDLNENC